MNSSLKASIKKKGTGRRDIFWVFRNRFRTAKAPLELNLSRYLKCNKKGFYMQVSCKWKTRKCGPTSIW